MYSSFNQLTKPVNFLVVHHNQSTVSFAASDSSMVRQSSKYCPLTVFNSGSSEEVIVVCAADFDVLHTYKIGF